MSVQSDEFSEVLAGGLQIALIKRGKTTTIALQGEWDLAERPAVDQAIRAAFADRPEQIVLDLSRLSFIDSTGIHGTVALAQRSAALNVRMAIVRGPRGVQRVFEVCQLTARLPFIDTSRN